MPYYLGQVIAFPGTT